MHSQPNPYNLHDVHYQDNPHNRYNCTLPCTASTNDITGLYPISPTCGTVVTFALIDKPLTILASLTIPPPWSKPAQSLEPNESKDVIQPLQPSQSGRLPRGESVTVVPVGPKMPVMRRVPVVMIVCPIRTDSAHFLSRGAYTISNRVSPKPTSGTSGSGL